MENLKNVMEKDTITSLELVEQINFFRKEEGKKDERESSRHTHADQQPSIGIRNRLFFKECI